VGLIAFVGADGNIYTMNQAGRNVVSITTDATQGGEFFRLYSVVRWSPDDQRLGFVGFSGEGTAGALTRVFVADRDGSNVQELFSSPNALPVNLGWTPDGTALTFLTTNSDGNILVLRSIPIDGGEVQVLDTGPGLFWDWSPAGDRLLIHAGGAIALRPDARLAFLHVGDRLVEEGLHYRPAFFQAPAFSPDGSRILIVAEGEAGNSEIVMADLAGENEHVLDTFVGSSGFDWSPDGRWVAFANSQNPNFVSMGPLTIVDAEQPTQPAIQSEGDSVIAFFWSPDGKRIAYFLPAYRENEDGEESLVGFDVHVMEAESGADKRLFTFSPTQDFFNVITRYDQYQRVTTVWSPDSQNIVIPAQTGNGPLIVVAQADGDFAPRGLQSGILASWSWHE
ncbi:MAG: TolB family protein, partial [Anaerolineales bacterium]